MPHHEGPTGYSRNRNSDYLAQTRKVRKEKLFLDLARLATWWGKVRVFKNYRLAKNSRALSECSIIVVQRVRIGIAETLRARRKKFENEKYLSTACLYREDRF